MTERITSRKNETVRRLRRLAEEGAFRREQGEILCDGAKLLQEALAAGLKPRTVLWKEEARPAQELEGARQFEAPAELFDYVSPMKNSPGPLFTVPLPGEDRESPLSNALVLEGVQDPGNVGTVLRTANAFGVGAVLLAGPCADPWQPKAVRSSMGAVFRQRVLRLETAELAPFLREKGLPLYGAALSPEAADVRGLSLKNAAVAVGSEGRGLSRELLALCRGQVIIPMSPRCESLNAAAAAAVLMWEMAR